MARNWVTLKITEISTVPTVTCLYAQTNPSDISSDATDCII